MNNLLQVSENGSSKCYGTKLYTYYGVLKIVLNLGVIKVLAWVSSWCVGFVYKGPWCLGFESRWEPRFLETLSPKQSIYIEALDLNYSFISSISKDRTTPVRFLRVFIPNICIVLHNLMN